MKQNFSAPTTLAATILLVTVLACSSATPTPSADDVATVVAGTLQAFTPAPSPTTQPTNAALPTSTSNPTAAPTSSNLPSAAPINFATGSTQAVVQGSIPGGKTLYYVVRALKDQPLIVNLDSPDQSVKLSIFGANGTVLLPTSQAASSWQGILPSTQDYYFRLDAAGNTQNFTLNVVIPARIKFASGQNQVTLTGQTAGGFGVSYVAYALSGQKLEVTINTDPNVAALTIWGFSDGQPYARAQNGVTNFSMTLPSTQDYIIQAVPQGGQVVNYTVTIKIQ